MGATHKIFADVETTGNIDLPSSKYIRWGAGDAQIQEGVTANYSLDFSTYNGSSMTKALSLEGNNNATFTGNVAVSGVLTLAQNDHVITDGSNFLDDSDNTLFSFSSGNIGSSGDISTTKSNATISATESGAATCKIMGASVGRVGTSTNHNLEILQNNGAAITIDTNKDATFAGKITTTEIEGTSILLDSAGDIELNADGADIILKDATIGFGRLKNDSSNFVIKSDISNKDMIFKGNDGGSTITALTLDMSAAGKATFNNDVVAFSDKKLKDNIETLDGKKVLDMRGVSFTRKDTGLPSSGVIAQELQEVAPELVNETNGTLGVSYGNLVGYLIEAIKDQQKQIDELRQNCNGCSK